MYREKGKERENDVETELKVAVCDDSQADRNILSQLVKKTADDMGIPVHIQEYSSGENLMEDILSEHDILFLDIQMEGMDGGDCLRFPKPEQECRIGFCYRSGCPHAGNV